MSKFYIEVKGKHGFTDICFAHDDTLEESLKNLIHAIEEWDKSRSEAWGQTRIREEKEDGQIQYYEVI